VSGKGKEEALKERAYWVVGERLAAMRGDVAGREEEIEGLAGILRGGGVVAFPTETVYGLGASAWQSDAIGEIYRRKGRPSDNPLIVHISRLSQLDEFASEIPLGAWLLIEAYWPGALTLILPKRAEVLDRLTGGLPSVALRMPAHPLALALIDAAGALVAPSANRSGRPSPTLPEHVLQDLGSDLPILRGGACALGLESTVLDLSQGEALLCRPGHLSVGALEGVLGASISPLPAPAADQAPRSPGMKYTHYAPQAAVSWWDGGAIPSDERIFLLVHRAEPPRVSEESRIVEFQGDLPRLARELYDRFRQADLEGFSRILIERLPPHHGDLLLQGITYALRDRINKAIGEPHDVA
jgi:L-threonylcarbamoyladenylate synthase